MKSKLYSPIATLLVGLLLSWTTLTRAADEVPLPQEITLNGVEFVLIPEGWFYRSVSALDDDWIKSDRFPLVRIWLDSYYIAKYEARSGDLLRFFNHQIDNNPDFSHKLHYSCIVRPGEDGYYQLDPGAEELPASGLSWGQSAAFAKWMGFRLPNESEWEKAARGTDKRLFPWGDLQPDQSFVVFGYPFTNPIVGGCEMLMPVDSFPEGRSPFGVYQMGGNVREYVADGADFIEHEYQTWLKDGMRNPPPGDAFTNSSYRILKGGRWGDVANSIAISNRAYRMGDWNPFRCNGLRFAVDADVVRQHLRQRQAAQTRKR